MNPCSSFRPVLGETETNIEPRCQDRMILPVIRFHGLDVKVNDDCNYLNNIRSDKTKNNVPDSNIKSSCISILKPSDDLFGDIKPRDEYTSIVKSIAEHQNVDIDQESQNSMALGIQFSGLDLDKIKHKVDLKIMKPNVIFYTWVAYHGTTIFDGINNPDKYANLNYVETIINNSKEFNKQKIPVMVVYSEINMTDIQVKEMNDLFSSNDNIITISLESDLKEDLKLSSPEIFSNKDMLFMLDAIRFAVIKDIPLVLKKAGDKAKAKLKNQFIKNINTNHGNSVIYMDTDDIFFGKVPTIISKDGLTSAPTFNRVFTGHYIDKEVLDNLSCKEKTFYLTHKEFFDGYRSIDNDKSINWERKVVPCYKYIYSGEAEENYKTLMKIYKEKKPNIYICPDCSIWSGENSMLYIHYDALKKFTEKASIRDMIIDFFKKPEPNSMYRDLRGEDSFYKEAHHLTGIQLLRYYVRGHDSTWHK